MRVYISGGITGVPDYKENFYNAEAKLKDLGYSVINPSNINDMLPDDFTYNEYMKLDYAMLDLCDTIYLIPGWNKSKGSKLELERALSQKMKIMTVEDLEKELKDIEPKKFREELFKNNVHVIKAPNTKIDLSKIIKVDY